MMKLVISLSIFLSLNLAAIDKVSFKNGDVWLGEIKEYKNNVLTLKSKLSENALAFKTSKLHGLSLGKDIKISQGAYDVSLFNGDGLSGDLLELNNKFLVLKTDFAGILQVPREHIKSLARNYYQQGSLLSGPIGHLGRLKSFRHAMKISEPTLISVDLNFKKSGFAITLSSNKRSNSFSSYVNLSIVYKKPTAGVLIDNKAKKQFLLAGRVTREGFHRLGTIQIPLSDKGYKIQMFIDPVKGKVVQMLNGFIFGEMDDIENLDLSQALFSISDLGGEVVVRGIKIEKWNRPITSASRNTSDVDDNLHLENGDVAHGKIQKIVNSELHFESSVGQMKIPEKMFRSINFSKRKVELPARSRAQLIQKTGMKITGHIHIINEDTIHFKSDCLGQLTLKKEYFSSVRYQGSISKVSDEKSACYFGENVVNGKITSLDHSKILIDNENLVEQAKLKSSLLSSLSFNNQISSKKNWFIELISGDVLPFNEITMSKTDLSFKLSSEEISLNKKLLSAVYTQEKIEMGTVKQREFRGEVVLPKKSVIKFSVRPKGLSLPSTQFIMFKGQKNKQYFINISKYASVRFREQTLRKEKSKSGLIPDNSVMELFIDKTKGVFKLYANGHHVNTFRDPKGFQGEEHNIRIRQQAGIISDISFRPWLNKEEKTDRALILFENLKQSSHSILKIDQNKVFTSENDYKLNEVKEIYFNSKSSKSTKGKYKLSFVRGGSTSLESFSIAGNLLKGQHKELGLISIDLAEISELKER